MKKAFTLAEVLITLMIIGIVAALTIPSVISNYQQQEFKTGLKKAVSVLNEAIQTNIAQEGETPYENGDLAGYLQRHMSILKTGTFSRCFNKNSRETYELDKNESTNCYAIPNMAAQQNTVFYTTDGMRFEITTGGGSDLKIASQFLLYETGIDAGDYKKRLPEICSPTSCHYEKAYNVHCGSYGLTNNPNNTLNPPCVVMVDVNGDRKPNPPIPYDDEHLLWSNGTIHDYAQQSFSYSFPSPSDKKLQDVFNILITDEKAIPYGVVAQRAMYSK